MDEASEAYLRNYYENHDEDSRLSSRMGQVEFATTKRYIDEVLQGKKCKILELGAGTGRYSIALAKEGHDVTAVELIEHNLDVLKSHLAGTESLCAVQGTHWIYPPFRTMRLISRLCSGRCIIFISSANSFKPCGRP